MESYVDNEVKSDYSMKNGCSPMQSRLLKLAKQCNSFYMDITFGGKIREDCLPFIVNESQVGIVRQDFVKHLRPFPNVFSITGDSVVLNTSLRSYDQRTNVLEKVLKEMRAKNELFALRGWRNEDYEVRVCFSDESLFKMDRSATCLFGICNYGVTINGYVEDLEKGLCVWWQQRSKTKQTWPGMWDNMVSGGLSVGQGILETAYKESEEEASLPSHLMSSLVPVGTVSYYFESERGLFPHTEFVYDLKLPPEFIPKNVDGEVEAFQLLTAKETMEKMYMDDVKTTSCPVIIDFLIRHGVIKPDQEPNYVDVVEMLHVPIQRIYKNAIKSKNGWDSGDSAFGSN